jgi:hypothetical protein
MRNVFYQILNGYWNSKNGKFQFGMHLDGYLKDVEGNIVTDIWSHVPIYLCTMLQCLESKWKEKWKEEAIDFLFK